jgi:hypothetical protein
MMAVPAALLVFLHLPAGLTHRALRQRVAAYLGLDLTTYTSGQMTYDVRRPRLKGLLWRVPGRRRYLVTPNGYRVALLFTTLNARVFRSTFTAFDTDEPVPRPLAEALADVDRQLDCILQEATLAPAACDLTHLCRLRPMKTFRG